MRRLAGVVHVEAATTRASVGSTTSSGAGCTIMRGVHAGERAALEQQDLAAAAFLGRRADHAHRQADVVGDRRGARSPAPTADGRDHVVTAGVADAGQRSRTRRRSRGGAAPMPGARHERRRQVADAALDREAGVGQRFAEPRRGALLLEAELRDGRGCDGSARRARRAPLSIVCRASALASIELSGPLLRT